MPIDVVGLIARIVALEKEGMAALSPAVVCDAVPHYFHAQEAYPYWNNRVSAVELEALDDADDYGEEIDRVVYEVTARLIIGHLTGGYTGERDAELYRYVPHMIRYFNDREDLKTTTTTTDLLGLIRCRVTSVTAFGVFQNSGVGVQQVGAEFVLSAEFIEDNQ